MYTMAIVVMHFRRRRTRPGRETAMRLLQCYATGDAADDFSIPDFLSAGRPKPKI